MRLRRCQSPTSSPGPHCTWTVYCGQEDDHLKFSILESSFQLLSFFYFFFFLLQNLRRFRSPRSGATVVADACSPSTNAFTSGHGLSQFLDSRDLTNSEIGVRSLTPALVHWLRTRISRWRGDAGGICFYLSTCHRAGTRGGFLEKDWLVGYERGLTLVVSLWQGGLVLDETS